MAGEPYIASDKVWDALVEIVAGHPLFNDAEALYLHEVDRDRLTTTDTHALALAIVEVGYPSRSCPPLRADDVELLCFPDNIGTTAERIYRREYNRILRSLWGNHVQASGGVMTDAELIDTALQAHRLTRARMPKRK